MFDLKLKQEFRNILHIDADAFFASVEQALDPRLKGRPVIVGGPSREKGIISAASYEARKFGIKSAMPTYQAFRLCPNAVLVPGNFEAYQIFSKRMFEIFSRYTDKVEVVSIDEAFLDISGCEKMHKKSALEIARAILNDVEQSLGITVSCGLTSNKTVSKIVSSLNKPNKLTCIPFGKEKEYLGPLSLSEMPGVGPKTFSILKTYGLNTLGDLAGMTFIDVVNKFGVSFVELWKRAQGVDNRKVKEYGGPPKSISKEMTFYEAPYVDESLRVLRDLSREVFSRLRKNKMQASTLCLKIRYKVNNRDGIYFKNSSFQRGLEVSSDADIDLYPVIKELFEKNLRKDMPVRLIGVGVSGLKKNYNLNLFRTERTRIELFQAFDRVRNEYGKEVLSFGV